MKNRLHDKKAGFAILAALIITSLAEVIYRAIALGEEILNTDNLGEQVAVIALAVIILVLISKGMDRACYICYGAWIGYFVLDHVFELPGTILPMLQVLGANDGTPILAYVPWAIRTVSMITIICLGVILVEYMNDGSIYNRAFNILSIITVVLLALNIIMSISSTIVTKEAILCLDAFNSIYRMIMIFMFTFFAYDSAKHQLKKASLTK